MHEYPTRRIMIAALASLAAGRRYAGAAETDGFYRGKRLTLIVGFAPGGTGECEHCDRALLRDHRDGEGTEAAALRTLDLFVCIFVMGIIINHISREFTSISTEQLSQLRD